MRLVVYDVSALAAPDAGTIDLLARLRLAARRAGCELLLRGAGAELRELIAFSGLDDVLLAVEVEGLPEEREEPLGREEEGQLGDPAA